LNAQEHYASRITAYTGYISPDEARRKTFIKINGVTDSSPGSILFGAAPAALIKQDAHYNLLLANVVMDYGMGHRFSFNDGLLPIESANFKFNSQLGARVTCARYDHLDMKDGDAAKKCTNNLTLFESLKKDMGL
jgi:hypothetical protein